MNTSLIKLNSAAYQYQLSIHQEFQNICNPLYQLGIKSFDYFKIFKDGSYLCMLSNKEYLKQFLFTIKDNGEYLTKQLHTVQNNKTHYLSFTDIKMFDKEKDPILFLLYDFNLWNSLVIEKHRHTDFVECYVFHMTRNDTNFHQFLLNNLNIFEHFCCYFNEKAENFIDCKDKSNLAFFEQQFNFYNNSKEDLITQKIEQFFQKTMISKNLLKTNDKIIPLSPREVDCLHFLSMGKTAKEIARILDLSHRTVETYLQKLKQKSDFNSKQLISHFVKSTSFK